MHIFEGKTADQAWLRALEFFRKGGGGRIPDSRTGPTREVLHAQFVIADPRQRWVISRNPPVNPAYAIVDVVWIITGREDSAFPNAWNTQLPKFAGAGETYHGAYGLRLRKHFGVDQILRIYEALRHNPPTRQAVLQMWDPSIDLPDLGGRPVADDIPCNVCAMLKVREGRLEWMQVLRSNDLALGVPYNFVQFTTLQEIMAGWLGVEVGSYYQLSDSLHIYERDLGSVLRSQVVDAAPNNNDSLAVPKEQSDWLFCELGRAIERLANPTLSRSDLAKIADTEFPVRPYKNLLLVIAAEAARRRRFNDLSTKFMTGCTNPVLVQLWQRWAKRFAASATDSRVSFDRSAES